MPGTGKTTRAKQIERARSALRLSPDDWLERLNLDLWDEPRRASIEALQWDIGKSFLAAGGEVVVEWGTWGRDERLSLLRDARARGAGAELHWLAAPIDLMLERVARRGREDPPITRADIEGWETAFQSPDAAELAAYDAVYRT